MLQKLSSVNIDDITSTLDTITDEDDSVTTSNVNSADNSGNAALSNKINGQLFSHCV